MTVPTSAAVERRRVPAPQWHEAVAEARTQGYAFFDWLSAVDETEPSRTAALGPDGEPLEPGLEVVLHLMDVARPGALHRLLLTTRVPEGAALASVTDLYPGAAWHERETAEMFGLAIDGFDDGSGAGVRPLLLPEGFEGTPLRKSFVLAARASKPWPGAKEPGEGETSTARRSPSRRRLLPPGVPDASWGPRGDA